MLSLLPLLLMTCLLQMSFPLHGLFVGVVLQLVTLLVGMVSLSFPSRLLIGMPSVILNGSLPWLRRSLRLSALALGILFLPLLVFVPSREHGRDYDETFAPVAHMTTMRTLLAVAYVRRWSVSQLDVQNAFLNGELSEEVYMQPPPGYSVPDGMVCRLRRSLYDLKQASRAWFERFASVVTAAGFSPSLHDPALFVHTSPRGRTLLLLYVDDMIITGDDPEYIAFVKARLRDQFLMTDLGPLRYFLGIEVSSTSDGFSISQEKYIQDLLARAALGDERTVDTPMELNVKLRPTDGDLFPDPTRYRHLVGSLVYLAVTRPDISYPVHILSQFVSAPTTVHYSHLLRVLRYLRGCTDFKSLGKLLKSLTFIENLLDACGSKRGRYEENGTCTGELVKARRGCTFHLHCHHLKVRNDHHGVIVSYDRIYATMHCIHPQLHHPYMSRPPAMSSTNNGAAEAGGAGTTVSAPRPHWRSRDPAATVVYVVHPDQFRDVVQQLTGAAPANTAPSESAPFTADANAALAQHGCHGGGGDDRDCDGTPPRATTLRQMMDECSAWATDDGYHCDDKKSRESSVPGTKHRRL
ncbi:hypothetical protein QYE76_057940 [Lolium multiflorum]|uniref:Reverse transcriptase Ty1/copia-type domain-containing protein n=1 Tax=Lolium multiflorum TaxID=4521 RepID=A0AAD8T4G9_LOLMU|nr:hypothetical protein QYE76_057940 [Lolium multiflorum]